MYKVKEAFYTIQGEGHHAGSAAVFCRFSGCNAWSGLERDRLRDSAKAGCAAWCDTDFRGGESYSVESLVSLLRSLWPVPGEGVVVFTGGEPSLQLDDRLVDSCHASGLLCWVETNGSRVLPSSVDWVCLSPKPPLRTVDQRYDEVKVVYPAFDPDGFKHAAARRFVQPQDGSEGAVEACVLYVKGHPEWRLSLQTHKLVGIP